MDMGEPVMCDAEMQTMKKPNESGPQQDTRAEIAGIPKPAHPP